MQNRKVFFLENNVEINYLKFKECFFNRFRLSDLKKKIEKETNIEINSQLIIFNNLLFDSLVTEQQTIETYPIIDKEHPLVLFSLNNTMSSDDLAVIKQS